MIQQDHRLKGLQAARAVAALSVAYFHSYIALRGFPEAAQIPIEPLKNWGYLGVNFFFAISGYVICLVASKPGFTVRSFVIKRVFRLYPIYLAVMAVVAVLIHFGKHGAVPLGHFLYSMTLLPQPFASAYDVSWTLEREIVFYMLAALTVPLIGIPGLAIVLASLAALGWCLGNPWTFHLVSTVQADFLAGVVVFIIGNLTHRAGTVVPLAAGCLGIWFTRSHEFAFAVPVCCALLLVGMLNLRLPWHRRPFRWIIAVGDASYSIYLLHYLVYLGSVNVAVRSPWLPPWLCEPWRFLTLLACCLIARATWRLIERPMIGIGNQLASERIWTTVPPSSRPRQVASKP